MKKLIHKIQKDEARLSQVCWCSTQVKYAEKLFNDLGAMS